MEGFKKLKTTEIQTENEAKKEQSRSGVMQHKTLETGKNADKERKSAGKSTRKAEEKSVKAINKGKKAGKLFRESIGENVPEIKKVRKKTVGDRIEQMHTELDAEIADAFKGYAGDAEIPGSLGYDSVKTSDRNKRIKEAMKREEYAEAIEDYEEAHENDPEQTEAKVRSKEELAASISHFMEDYVEEFDLDTDEKFVANLEKNHMRCRQAARIKKLVDQALDGGYLPDNIDMVALQTKIAGFEELKVYLDNRSKLVRNPYYKYFTSGDMSFSEGQIDRILQKSDNTVLKDYFTTLKNLRAQNFQRKKGIKSMSKQIQARGKNEAKILATRARNREIIAKFSDHALNFRESSTFRDKDYDSKYDRKVFKRKLDKFNALSLTELHFASIRDIADHFEENTRIFEQSREIENLLVHAINADNYKISDEEIMELRAKIRVIGDVEKLVFKIQSICVTDPDNLLKKKTYEEIENEALRDVSSQEWAMHDAVELPHLGMSLTGHYSKILKSYRQEQEESRENIRKMYCLMHPVTIKDGDQDKTIPGSITDKELDERVKDYQKNALFTDHMANGLAYISTVWESKSRSFRSEYMRQTGIDTNKILKPDRSMTGYVAGMSSTQLKQLVDTLTKGSADDKYRIYESVIKEVDGTDPAFMEMKNSPFMKDNFNYKLRMANILGNIKDFKDYVRDTDEISKAKAQIQYTVGCGHFNDSSCIAQKLKYGKWARTIKPEDYFNYQENSEDLISEIEEASEFGQDYIYNDTTFVKAAEWDDISTFMKTPEFLNKARMQDKYMGQPGKSRYTDSAQSFIYRESVATGLWKKTTAEELENIKDFYNKENTGEHPEGELNKLAVSLIDEVPGEEAAEDKIRDYFKNSEKIFLALMDADLNLFTFRSYKEITEDPERFKKCAELTKLAAHAVLLTDRYSSLLGRVQNKAGNIGTLLNADHLAEIKARCDLLKNAAGFFDTSFGTLSQYSVLKDFDSLDDCLHQPDQLYLDRIAQAREKINSKDEKPEVKKHEQQVVDELEAIRGFIKNLNGYDINTPLSVLEKRMRAGRGIKNDRKTTPLQVANILKGTASVLKDINAGGFNVTLMGNKTRINAPGSRFAQNKMSTGDREKLLFKPGTEQYVKKQNMEGLNSRYKSVVNSIYEIRNSISLNYRIDLGDECVDALIAFMKPGEKKANEELLKKYSDKDTRNQVLDTLTAEIVKLDVKLDLTSDEDIVNSAAYLETLTRAVNSYRKLMALNPEYKKRLENKREGADAGDAGIVNERIGSLLALSDYYRARKLLITDPYYVLHKNSELSMNGKGAETLAQRRIASYYDLVNRCAKRIQDHAYTERDADDTGHVLNELETKAAQVAYLTGRPDISKMDPARLKKTHKNIETFLRRAGIDRTKENNTRLLNIDDPNAFPGLQKYLTEDVKNYLKVAAEDLLLQGGMNADKLDHIGSQGQKLLYNRLDKLITYTVEEKDKKTGAVVKKDVKYTSFMLKDPKTGEVFSLHTDASRLVIDLVYCFGTETPEEELLDIVEGLLVGQKGELDLTDEKQMAYARNRWISSVKKLYDLEYNSVARFEKTYGSLLGDVPTGCFMQSMGSGLADYHLRGRFVQNVLEISDEKEMVTAEGEKISVGEYLARAGMIRREDNQRMTDLTAGLYQGGIAHTTSYYRNMQMNFGVDQGLFDGSGMTAYHEVNNWAFTKSRVKMAGPRVSASYRRKLWKEANAVGDKNVTGGDHLEKVNAENLNLYTSSERKAIKKQRREDLKTVKYADRYMDMRASELAERTIAEIDGSIPDSRDHLTDAEKDLIRTTLIYFNPGMSNSGSIVIQKNGEEEIRYEARVPGTPEYYENVKKFFGKGITGSEPRRLEARKTAFKAFMDSCRSVITGQSYTSPESIMSGENVRAGDGEVISGTNDLLKLLARHRMHEALQDLTSDKDTTGWLDADLNKVYRKTLKSNLKFEIIYSMMHSNMYLDVKDLGNPGRTDIEKSYEILKNVAVHQIEWGSSDLDSDILTDEVLEILRSYGIRVDGSLYDQNGNPRKAEIRKPDSRLRRRDQIMNFETVNFEAEEARAEVERKDQKRQSKEIQEEENLEEEKQKEEEPAEEVQKKEEGLEEAKQKEEEKPAEEVQEEEEKPAEEVQKEEENLEEAKQKEEEKPAEEVQKEEEDLEEAKQKEEEKPAEEVQKKEENPEEGDDDDDDDDDSFYDELFEKKNETTEEEKSREIDY